MVSVARLERLAVAVVAVTLLLTGPFGVVDATARNPTTVGDGRANATVERLDTSGLLVEGGRFGTGVDYLRIPDATVAVSDIEGRPRLVYRVSVPELGVDRTTTKLLSGGQSGTVRLGMRDRGLDPDSVTEQRYRATITVRVQSFEYDQTVFETDETVEVRP
ncbi:hypothetical protein ACAH01_03520 [Halomicrobium sp. HM KBTZ05]|uniref:Uncharacterized protein n=1 Tax=Halomicrobium mukohataei TaxID=57705 RepID=A0A847U5E2_9EURY|nr:hypothetical protein [Halomicrobium mukohataei]NLV08525.1 hypothetical protein [Halomicrobium mukohataei]